MQPQSENFRGASESNCPRIIASLLVAQALHPPVHLADAGLCTISVCISELPRQLSPRISFAN
jgi:hypothetical protein